LKTIINVLFHSDLDEEGNMEHIRERNYNLRLQWLALANN
jgi:hypothetical protein